MDQPADPEDQTGDDEAPEHEHHQHHHHSAGAPCPPHRMHAPLTVVRPLLREYGQRSKPRYSDDHESHRGLRTTGFTLPAPHRDTLRAPRPAHWNQGLSIRRRPYSGTRRSRSALPMTDTELRLIAALAMIGFIRIPSQG